MHDVGIFHRDISDGNIMIDAYGNGRLVDFDLSKLKDETGKCKSLRVVGNRFLNVKDQSLT
jgi:serine/threonine protein kinase